MRGAYAGREPELNDRTRLVRVAGSLWQVLLDRGSEEPLRELRLRDRRRFSLRKLMEGA